jgi:NADPH2:quinone reductase
VSEVATLTLPGFGGYAEVAVAPADLTVSLEGSGVARAQAVAALAKAKEVSGRLVLTR